MLAEIAGDRRSRVQAGPRRAEEIPFSRQRALAGSEKYVESEGAHAPTRARTQIFRKRRPRDDDDEDDLRFARDGDRVIVPALLKDSAASRDMELHRPGYRTGPAVQAGMDPAGRQPPGRPPPGETHLLVPGRGRPGGLPDGAGPPEQQRPRTSPPGSRRSLSPLRASQRTPMWS